MSGECANRGRGLRPRWTGIDSLEKVIGNNKEGCANLLEMRRRAGPSPPGAWAQGIRY